MRMADSEWGGGEPERRKEVFCRVTGGRGRQSRGERTVREMRGEERRLRRRDNEAMAWWERGPGRGRAGRTRQADVCRMGGTRGVGAGGGIFGV